MTNKLIAFRIKEETKYMLDTICKVRGVDKSEAVRRAINQTYALVKDAQHS